MLSRWIYVLIGNNNTGKTTFQKRVLYHLTGFVYQRLDINRVFDITHKNAPKKLKTIFLINRSLQEQSGKDLPRDNVVEGYFENRFRDASVCILSSHAIRTNIAEIEEVIKKGKERKYNIGGVFFSNASTNETAEIALLNWDEKFYLENPVVQDDWETQVNDLAKEFSEMLIRRAAFQ